MKISDANYAWVLDEMAGVKTPKFFTLADPCDVTALAANQRQFPHLPIDYTCFIKQFGGARLFRHPRELGYLITFFSSPEIVRECRYAPLVHIGNLHGQGMICFRPEIDRDSRWNIYEQRGANLFNTKLGFSEWFASRWSRSKNFYSKKAWAKYVAGPKPFTPEEQLIVEARLLYSINLLGHDDSGLAIVEVTNGSSLVLPTLTVRVDAGKRERGAIWLNVSDVFPGSKKILHEDIYKTCFDQRMLKLSIEQVGPEDRAYFKELNIGSLSARGPG